MSREVLENMVYSFKVPMWHNLAEPSQEECTATEILFNRFNGGVSIGLRPVTIWLNGQNVETGDFAIVRSSVSDTNQEKVFGYCSERYKPLQPYEVCQVYDSSVNRPAETMGFLYDGKQMFISFKMPSFEVVSGDQLDFFGVITTGFDSLKGTSLFTSVYRPICANTLSMAASWAEKNTDGKGRGNVWNSKHVNKNLLRDLGYWSSFIVSQAERQQDLLKGFFNLLINKPVKNDDEVKGILVESFPDKIVPDFIPEELVNEKQEKVESENYKSAEIRDGIYSLFAGGGVAITPDYYGILNSTSEYFCHKMPSKKPIAASVMFGGRQKMMTKVVDVLKSKVY